ncbi:rRNA methyltransferase [Paenisporosarcina cavernae]|uniref:rRNA methyltransferase n=1 Tax=Paenisporosarcina cavernae TaxID=2320858 RepID=A0A385YT34_9BACL|nr:rRNA methyltransferase [Paenisporosarcina cavernae]AYC29480.1 rRNA methyltransferase [Paenisporosarcina cavernae]
MWIKIGDRLYQANDSSRVKFRTTFSKRLLEELRALAEKNHTYANYLLETGLEKTLRQNEFVKDQFKRPTDRIQYKTTFDKDLLNIVRKYAKDKNVSINDIMEYSVKNIDLQNAKSSSHRFRVEE